MTIQAIIAREVTINGQPIELPGLKLVTLKEKTEIPDNFEHTGLTLTYTPKIEPFNNEEHPFTITTDHPLHISLSSGHSHI